MILNVHTILAPTDFSPCAEQACEHASFLADRFGADLHIVTVEPESQKPAEAWLEDVDVTARDICEQLRILVDTRDETPETSEPQVIRRTAYHNRTAKGILRYADAHDVDLIVMGTHGRDRLDQLVLGSVAERVVRHADCPVLTVNRKAEVNPEAGVEDIVCPVDFSAFTEHALRCAVAVAETYDAHLHLLHVEGEESPVGIAPEDSAAQVVGGNPRSALEALVDEMNYAPASVHVTTGDPGSRIVDFAAEQDADLVILSTHGRTGLQRVLLGSVAEAVIRRASCPVLTLRSFGKSMLRTSRGETESETE